MSLRAALLAGLFLAATVPSRAQPIDSPMVAVPAGAFLMGSDDGPDDERPAHRLHLGAFEIDRLPVSNRQFARFLQQHGPLDAQGRRLYDWDDHDARIHRHDRGWLPDEGYADHPVVEASWLGALAYCGWLGKRLPTEAEWEKAARGPDGRAYPWGNDAPDASRAHFASGYNQTVPVGSPPRGASPYGALEMAGNVWQWVSSAYRPYPYRADDGREDLVPGPVRATRGGGHDASGEQIRSAHRARTLSRAPAAGHHNIGFRCAR